MQHVRCQLISSQLLCLMSYQIPCLYSCPMSCPMSYYTFNIWCPVWYPVQYHDQFCFWFHYILFPNLTTELTGKPACRRETGLYLYLYLMSYLISCSILFLSNVIPYSVTYPLSCPMSYPMMCLMSYPIVGGGGGKVNERSIKMDVDEYEIN